MERKKKKKKKKEGGFLVPANIILLSLFHLLALDEVLQTPLGWMDKKEPLNARWLG